VGTKVFFVVNPVSAGKKTFGEWPAFEKQLKALGYSFDWNFTEYPQHATSITGEKLKQGYNLIVSVGGDGTMNEVVNGFFEQGEAINPEACLAVFSRGTGCDFIRSMGITKSFEDFVKVLERSTVKTLDAGHVSFATESGEAASKFFLNISDIGLGGETTRRVNKTKKHLKGFFAFLIGAILTILKYRNKRMHLEIDGKVIKDEKINSIIVANAKYFGGGMLISPESVPNDGLLDIIVLGNISALELIRNFHLIYTGKHLSQSKVYHYTGKRIKVSSQPYGLLEIDGEQPGITPAEFKIIPQAIKVLV
jgi:diacylglycerol kinase (ATP)